MIFVIFYTYLLTILIIDYIISLSFKIQHRNIIAYARAAYAAGKEIHMLKLTDIKKDYVTGDSVVHALKGVSLEFRESEFVSILGASGCGKTTLLNIVGGLDRYTFGDLIINGKSTKNHAIFIRLSSFCFLYRI